MKKQRRYVRRARAIVLYFDLRCPAHRVIGDSKLSRRPADPA